MDKTFTDGVDFHQTLMNEAYARWQDAEDLGGQSWEDFVKNLSPIHQDAVVLGKYNQQVQNGGHIQWVDNEYNAGDTDEILVETLMSMEAEGFHVGRAVFLLLEELATYIQRREDMENDKDYDIWDNDPDELWSLYYDEVENSGIDERFYEFSETFEIQCEFYLRGSIAFSEISDADKTKFKEALSFEAKEVSAPKIKAKPRVKLVGKDGNIFSIFASMKKVLDKDQYEEFLKKAQAGNYDNALRVCMEYADVY